MLTLDHLAVAAGTLEAGRAYVEEALGVALEPGGQHAHFGTHNMLLGLEDGLYLELIAVDPGAPRPGYARWFDLDRFDGRPRPQVWISRTQDLPGFVEKYPQAGEPVALERGDLRWRMAVPESGILPYDNAFPAVIQWDCDAHPAAKLPASGCRLERMIVSHPEAGRLQQELAEVLHDARIVFEAGPPALRYEIATPSGLKVLE